MTDMRCPRCGAEMHLIEVAPDKTKMVPGYEQHTFECSGCHDHVRQLAFIPRAIGPLNSEEMRLSAAWLETLNKGTTPKGDDDLARAVRAVSPIKAVYVVGDPNYLCGSGLTDNLGPKFERANGRSRTTRAQRSTRRCRPTEHNIRHSDRSLKLR
jgi:hypothetical protein